MCGQDRRVLMPAAWSLAAAGAPPLPPGASLADAGVTDGQVLYLRDITGDPALAPVVEDLDELVIGDAQRLKREAGSPGAAAIAAGLCWITVAAVYLAGRHGPHSLTAAVSLACAGLALPSTAWALSIRQVRVPPTIRLAMSLASIPCLTVAGTLLGDAVAGSQFVWAGAIAGANAAVAITLATTPEAILFALELQFAAAAVMMPVLLAVQATLVQAAAAIAV